jgi:hypothetical protein
MRAIKHEKAAIKAFVVREMRAQFLSFIVIPEDRWLFTRELANFQWFDPKYATLVPWRVNPSLSPLGQHLAGISNLSLLLRSRGARETCWVISKNSQIDAREMNLGSALDIVAESDWGTILSIIPGKLAYFKGAGESLLLER